MSAAVKADPDKLDIFKEAISRTPGMLENIFSENRELITKTNHRIDRTIDSLNRKRSAAENELRQAEAALASAQVANAANAFLGTPPIPLEPYYARINAAQARINTLNQAINEIRRLKDDYRSNTEQYTREEQIQSQNYNELLNKGCSIVEQYSMLVRESIGVISTDSPGSLSEAILNQNILPNIKPNINWNDPKSLITESFTVREATLLRLWTKNEKKDIYHIPNASEIEEIKKMANAIQIIRDTYGRSMNVTSWYRPKEVNLGTLDSTGNIVSYSNSNYNKKNFDSAVKGVGGHHTTGLAVDIAYNESLEKHLKKPEILKLLEKNSIWVQNIDQTKGKGYIHFDLGTRLDNDENIRHGGFFNGKK
ncbi:MAG: hypothetical protein FWD47_05750 [Treponema sp.]|nr:hypothetical protein [Treponema sp.]